MYLEPCCQKLEKNSPGTWLHPHDTAPAPNRKEASSLQSCLLYYFAAPTTRGLYKGKKVVDGVKKEKYWGIFLFMH